MKLALESPRAMMDEFQPLADYDFILAHLVLEHPYYADWYARSERIKILDNSTNELLTPCSIEDIAKAAEIVDPDYVCPPDFLGDAERTFKSILETIDVFTGIDDPEVFPIVQGTYSGEVLYYAKKIQELGFKKIAIPYDITQDRTKAHIEVLGRSRFEVVKDIMDQLDFEWIHLLGFVGCNELRSYQNTLGSEVIQSIDTGSPITNALGGIQFNKDPYLDKRKMLDFDTNPDQVSPDTLALCYYNIGVLRTYLSGGNLDGA